MTLWSRSRKFREVVHSRDSLFGGHQGLVEEKQVAAQPDKLLLTVRDKLHHAYERVVPGCWCANSDVLTQPPTDWPYVELIDWLSGMNPALQ